MRRGLYGSSAAETDVVESPGLVSRAGRDAGPVRDGCCAPGAGQPAGGRGVGNACSKSSASPVLHRWRPAGLRLRGRACWRRGAVALAVQGDTPASLICGFECGADPRMRRARCWARVGFRLPCTGCKRPYAGLYGPRGAPPCLSAVLCMVHTTGRG